MTGPATGSQLHPRHALLGGLDQVEPAAAHGRAESADLPDSLGASVELVTVLLDEHLGASMAAGLLVCGEAEHDRPLGHVAGLLPCPHRREEHRVEVLHVDGATTPHVAVPHLAAERVDLPVRGRRGHDVEMPVQQQPTPLTGRPVAVAAPGRHDRRTTGLGLVEPRLDADVLEQPGDVLGRLALPRTLLVTVVGRVDPDQFTAELHDLRCRVVRRVARARSVLGAHVSIVTLTCAADGVPRCG